MTTQRRVTRPRSRRTTGYTDDPNDDFTYEPVSRLVRPSRSMRRPRTYRERSDDSDEAQEESSATESDSQPPSTRAQAIPQSTVQQQKKRQMRRRGATRRSGKEPNFNLFKKRKPNTSTASFPDKPIIFPLGPSGKRPRWQGLPYEALHTIMKHAAYPLYGIASRSTGSIEWLCRVSRLSRSIHDACMAALLHSPPLYPASRAQGLLDLLQRDQSKLMINYRTKIRRLDIEVMNVLFTRNGLNLEELVGFTPNLEHIRLYHNHDDFNTIVWAQPSNSTQRKWTYPEELFDKLDANNIRLKSFEWNGRFPAPLEVIELMARSHARPCFSRLESLTVLNIKFPEKYPEEDLTEARNLLITCLSKLSDLRDLTVRNCTLLDEVTTPQLPYSLQSLEVTNNIAFLSSHLASYLTDRGSLLTSLTLKHNQSMSLEFLSNLATYTPRLRYLCLDLSYSDPSSYQDVNPLYDDALPDGPPTWPSTMISIEIENLRQISSAEAEEFFNSLVASAPSFTWLRKLVIKAIIRDAGWRERADLRTKWIPRLDEIFLDTSVPRPVRSLPPPKILAADESSNTDSSDSDNIRSRKRRRSGRLREVHNKSISIEDDLSPIKGEEQTEQTQPRHGRCNIVMLDISDQRPAQEQYRETDFLDDEPSDDGDYRG